MRASGPYSSRICASSGSISGPSMSTRVGTVHHPHGLDAPTVPGDLRIREYGHAPAARPEKAVQRRPQLGRADEDGGEAHLLGRLGEMREVADDRLGPLGVDGQERAVLAGAQG